MTATSLEIKVKIDNYSPAESNQKVNFENCFMTLPWSSELTLTSRFK